MLRKRPLMILLLLWSLGCALLPPTHPPMATPAPSRPSEGTADLSSFYRVTGTNPNGRPYQGTLTIETRGEVYVLRWETGGTSIEGVGLRKGNILSAGWDCGVVTYSVLEDGTLEGIWALCGGDEVGTERAVPQQPGVQG